MSAADVAASLGLDARAVERLAEAGELPARRVGGRWQFRAADVTNWAAANLPVIRKGQSRARGAAAADLLISRALRPDCIAVPLPARTGASVLQELVHLAERSGSIADSAALLRSLVDREKQCATALPGGVAIPHSAQVGRQLLGDDTIVAAGRVPAGIPFGDPQGDLTDLFFLLCCPDYPRHLVYLGRLCRLLSDAGTLDELRAAEDAERFVQVLQRHEKALCGVK